MEFSALIPWAQSLGASVEAQTAKHFSCILQKYRLEFLRDAKIANRCHLMSEICPFPQLDEQAELFVALLRANLFGQGTHGAVIGADRKSRKIYYIRIFDLRRLNQNLFVFSINNFIQWLERWKRGIAQKDYYWPFVKDTLGSEHIRDFWKRI